MKAKAEADAAEKKRRKQEANQKYKNSAKGKATLAKWHANKTEEDKERDKMLQKKRNDKRPMKRSLATASQMSVSDTDGAEDV